MKLRSRRLVTAQWAIWLAVSAAAPWPAIADDAKADGHKRVISGYLDSNGDGRISYDEFVHSVAAKAMREMDADHNKVLTRSELKSVGSAADRSALTIKLQDVDANKDDQVSLTELEKALRKGEDAKKWFSTIDRNGDGYISKSELDDYAHGTGPQVVPQIRISIP